MLSSVGDALLALNERILSFSAQLTDLVVVPEPHQAVLISGHLLKSHLSLGVEVVVIPVHEFIALVIGYADVDCSIDYHIEWP